MYAGFLTKSGAAKATWVGFDPLATAVHSPGRGMDYWILGVWLACAGLMLIGACVLATVLRRRAPSMTLLRMPVFTWAMTATVLMVVVSCSPSARSATSWAAGSPTSTCSGSSGTPSCT
jgi:cytochrome c oxidase subunit 1